MFTDPTKTTVIVIAFLCFVGNCFLILAATDYFKETLFQKKNILIIGIMSMSIITTFKLYLNYLKNKYQS